ncbi:MAG: molybdopterin-guanine dinucleotide biosynthesis protein B [Pirellulaceae bacterium]|jgi:molybdopterin-guanine dinucleotide biosynthesis protein MobB|nr:molybdopterin-guanine dinucleotide biosynthesis protein B [Pirellulaceae bacterium]MDP7017924.1 molybdopterin-guanine dinucleotide biosynthesis protein B [Pirellulaceae bacterium]
MNRLHIVGRKNSGKTTLISELVEHFTGGGLKIGTIKHTHHHHELDTPGKDSHQHREAGSAVVGILCPAMTAVFRPTPADGSRDDSRYEFLAPTFRDCDLVLVEGDLQTAGPKVEVWRSISGERPLASDDRSILAVVADTEISAEVPVWPRSDLSVIAQEILQLRPIKSE